MRQHLREPRRARTGGGTGKRLCARKHVLRAAFENFFARKHAVEDAAQGIDIGRRTHERRGLPDLFRGHPTDGSRTRVLRDLRSLGSVETRVVSVLAKPREPQVEDVRAWTGTRGGKIEHDVRWLQVAVNDATCVGVRETGEHLVDEGPHDRATASCVVCIHSLAHGRASITRYGEPS